MIIGMTVIPFVHLLPCLRCGQNSVGVSLLTGPKRRETVECLSRECEAVHYLQIDPIPNGFNVVYDRYTLRYPLEMYDDGLGFPVVRVHLAREGPKPEEGFAGPVCIYPRKKRFSAQELQAIWRCTSGRCHLCCRRWRLRDRGRAGWHVDHVIPHAGGGHETEEMQNFRVACAKCNLTKGRGYKQARIRASIAELISHFRVR